MDLVKGFEEPHLVALLEWVWRRTKRELDTAGRELAPDLRPSHVRLISITPAGGMRLGDLATKAGMTAQSLGELVDTLNRAGYTEVIPDPADRCRNDGVQLVGGRRRNAQQVINGHCGLGHRVPSS